MSISKKIGGKLPGWQKKVFALNGGVYLVGGAVRDKIINPRMMTKDSDYLVTNIPMKKLVALLKEYGRVELVGKSFGVIKFTQNGFGSNTVDIALPREEYSVGLGHRDFVVKYSHELPIEADLTRRDFTINAMAYNLETGELVDPLNGRADIKRKLIRMITPKSFVDDPLRMLRAAQFAARFGFKIEKSTLSAMQLHSKLVKTVSNERVQEEINKLLLKSGTPSYGFKLMQDTGLLEHIIPELTIGSGVIQNEFHKYDVFLHNLYSCDYAPQDNIVVRLTALLHDIGKVGEKKKVKDKKTGHYRVVFYNHEQLSVKQAEGILNRLRYSNDVIRKVTHLIKYHMFEYTNNWTSAAVRRFIAKVGLENLEDMFALRIADRQASGTKGVDYKLRELKKRISQEVENKVAVTVSSLVVDGYDIMKTMGIPSSPIVGKVLDYLLECVMDNPGCNNKKELLRLAREYKVLE
ncbi:MAG: HD domain-containing protein [Elusimicrobiota bacterium]